MPDDTYTHGHHPSVLRSHTWRSAENSAGYLLSHLRPGMSMLDVGCGPGTITADLAARVAPGEVLGIDRGADVIAQASAAHAGRRDSGSRWATSTGWPPPTMRSTSSTPTRCSQHLSDPVAALVEMRRVCRPGGIVAVRDADYGAFTWAPADPVLDAWLDAYRAVARSNEAEPDAGRHLKRWALAAGFSSAEATASVWCFTDDDDRAWWGGLWADRVVESDLARQLVDGGIATTAELEGFAAAFRRWADAPDGWFIVPHGEVLARR